MDCLSPALDVLGYPGNRFDFALRVYTITGSSPGAIISLYTSMYNDDNNDNWTLLDSAFATINTSNTTVTLSVNEGVLRYVKWKASFTTTNICSFEILGVAW